MADSSCTHQDSMYGSHQANSDTSLDTSSLVLHDQNGRVLRHQSCVDDGLQATITSSKEASSGSAESYGVVAKARVGGRIPSALIVVVIGVVAVLISHPQAVSHLRVGHITGMSWFTQGGHITQHGV